MKVVKGKISKKDGKGRLKGWERDYKGKEVMGIRKLGLG